MDDDLLKALARTRVALGVLDREGRYVFASAELGELLGTSPAALVGAPIALHDRRAFEDARRGSATASVELAPGRSADLDLVAAGDRVVAVFHKRDGAAAERERAIWKRLFEDAPAQVSVFEAPDLRYGFVNAAWRNTFGEGRTVIGKTAGEAFPEYGGTPVQAAVERAFVDGTQIVLPEHPLEVAGERRFMTFLLQPFRVEGQIGGVIAVSFDVTEQARARQALEALVRERDRLLADLEAEHDRLASMFTRNLVGTFTWNLDGRILDANDAFLKAIGYTREDLAEGRVDWQRLTPPEYVGDDAIHIKSLLENGSHVPFEKEYIRKDGSRVPVLISAAFFEGNRREGLSYVVDLSAVKAAQAAVRASEQRFRSLIEATSQTVWTTDATGAVLEPSPSWTAFTGQTEEERRGFGWLDAIHDDDREVAREHWLAAVEARVICDQEYRLRRRDGTYANVTFKGVPLKDDHGNVREWVGANTDVTPQRSAAAERERLLCAAQAASRAKDEFLGTLSHELRTPLNAIIGWTTLLQGGVIAPDQQRRALDIIERNARAQARLVEDLLDVSRISREKLTVERAPVEIGRIVQTELDAERPALDAKGVHLVERIDPAVRVSGDAGRLQQVIANLVSNALKFTDSGGTVTVTVTRRGNSVVLAVADDGRGIAPAFLPHVFEPFRQADSSTSRVAGGLGLGLAIARTIVELHGGTITARSDGLGRGSTFEVTLPAVATLRGEAQHRDTDVRARDRDRLGGVRVLVVDDEPDARALLQTLLEGFGARVATASCSTEALDALAHAPFDVLLSDIAMPGEDGYALIHHVRDNEDEAHLPAVAVTAFARGEDRTRAIREGYDVHVPKPVEPAELVRTIADLVSDR